MKKKLFTRAVGVVLDEKLHKLLVELTESQEVSKSEFIRSLIENHFQKRSETKEENQSHEKGERHHG